MTVKSNWTTYFGSVMMVLMLSMALYCIYQDGFFRYTWLSHVCLAAMMWVLFTGGSSLEAKLKVQSPRFWVAIVAMAGMLADVFVNKNS